MSAANTAMAKVRARIRREIAAAEESEHEGGEINLVPYLDIITNTVIFMLATTALSITLANINVAAPRYAEPAAGAASAEDDDTPKLNLTVAVTDTGFRIGGSGGILPLIPCKGALVKGRCPAAPVTRANDRGDTELVFVDQYDYQGLAKKIADVKKKWVAERQAVLTADRAIPYQVVVKTMDTLRGRSTKKCTGDDGCMFDQVILSAGVQ
ncbi:MAG: biopolymer transporter ExbD [Deltaproteobacteria bacterium]|nr:biopolymer transporter ExbD [Deltaproteobacteria bacterium]